MARDYVVDAVSSNESYLPRRFTSKNGNPMVKYYVRFDGGDMAWLSRSAKMPAPFKGDVETGEIKDMNGEPVFWSEWKSKDGSKEKAEPSGSKPTYKDQPVITAQWAINAAIQVLGNPIFTVEMNSHDPYGQIEEVARKFVAMVDKVKGGAVVVEGNLTENGVLTDKSGAQILSVPF